VAVMVDRGWGYLIVLAVGSGTVIAVRGVMRRMLQDAIEYGAQSQARWERRATAQRPGTASVHELKARRGRGPARR
jgi:hypothetical protein